MPRSFRLAIIGVMVRIGISEDIPADLLRDFPENVQIVRLPDTFQQNVEVEVWIPPTFGWQSASIFQHLQGVKFVQCLLAGVDWITPWLPKEILLCDGQGIHNTPVAEWVVAAVLGSLKRFPEYRDRQREQAWAGQVRRGGANAKQEADRPGNEENQRSEARVPYRILGDELAQKKVLIVGYGGIGEEVERLIHPFDVEVLRVARTARAGVSAMGELEMLLPKADVVVLLVPLTPATRGLMNTKMLARMKPGALLVNAARGPVVDTDALLAALNTGRLHAVLDVMDPEPLPPGQPLWLAPNCFITPHVAGSVAQYAARAYKFAAEQIRRYVAGEPLKNRVNSAGY